MFKSSQVTKDPNADWMVANGELHELLELLNRLRTNLCPCLLMSDLISWLQLESVAFHNQMRCQR